MWFGAPWRENKLGSRGGPLVSYALQKRGPETQPRSASRSPKVVPTTPMPELAWAEQERDKTRTMSERVNARLRDEFGANHLRPLVRQRWWPVPHRNCTIEM